MSAHTLNVVQEVGYLPSIKLEASNNSLLNYSPCPRTNNILSYTYEAPRVDL